MFGRKVCESGASALPFGCTFRSGSSDPMPGPAVCWSWLETKRKTPQSVLVYAAFVCHCNSRREHDGCEQWHSYRIKRRRLLDMNMSIAVAPSPSQNFVRQMLLCACGLVFAQALLWRKWMDAGIPHLTHFSEAKPPAFSLELVGADWST